MSVSGDGRNDSPGHCAQYCVYTLMEHSSGDILAQQVIDRREVDFKSPNMEREGFKRCMTELDKLGLKPNEVVTDAHPQIPTTMSMNNMSNV